MSIALSGPISYLGTDSLYDLGDRILAIKPGSFGPGSLTVLDSAGAALFAPVEVPAGDAPWHVRDDGAGAFTLFNLGAFDPVTSQLPGQITRYDAAGTVIERLTYEFPTTTLDVGGLAVEVLMTQVLSDAVDLGDGRIAGVFYDMNSGTGGNLVIYDAQGQIERQTAFEMTTAPVLGAAALPSLKIARSGDNLVVLHRYNDPFTNPVPEEAREIYFRIFDQSGNATWPETRLSQGDHVMGGFGFAAGDFEVESLRDGRVVVAYRNGKVGTEDAAEHDVWLSILDGDGSVPGPERLVNTGYVLGSQSGIGLHALQDGGFAVTFDHNRVDVAAGIFENTGLIQLYDPTGAPVGGNQAFLERFSFAAGSLILEDGTGVLGSNGTGRAITLEVGAPIPDVNASGPVGPGAGPTAGNDDLRGSGGRDVVDLLGGDDTYRALGGNDAVKGGAGADSLLGGPGQDRLDGGGAGDLLEGEAGADTLLGRGGNDTLKGGGGADLLKGAAGLDLLDGGADNDRLLGGAGGDELRGGKGADTLKGGAGANLLYGGPGNDVMTGGPDFDVLEGGPGRDRIVAGAGNDSVNGGGGNDVIDGGAGINNLVGGAGDDRLIGGDGQDRYVGGAGRDTFVFSNTGGLEANQIIGFQPALDTIEIHLNGAPRSSVTVDPGVVSTTIGFGPNQLISIDGVFTRSEIDFDFV